MKLGSDRFRIELKRASGPFLLYVLLFIAGILTTADILNNLTGTKPWKSYTTVQAAFTDAKGIIPASTAVRESGVNVGTVTGGMLGDHGKAVLTLSILSQYAPLYKNAHIIIRPITPLEDMYVDITNPGTKSAGALGMKEILHSSGTGSPVETGEVLDTFQPNTRLELASLLNQLADGVGGSGGDRLRMSFQAIAPFLQTANRLTSALAERHAALARLVHNFGGISQELALRDQQLEGFVVNANQIVGALARTNGPFASTIQQLPPTLNSVSSAFSQLRSAEGTLDPALQSLGPVANALPAGLQALGSFSRRATPALVALRPSVRALRPLATTLKPTAVSLSGAFHRLRPIAPQLDYMTKLAAKPACLGYIGEFLSRVMSITKFGTGVNNTAQGRADVQIDFSNFNTRLRSANYHTNTICYSTNKGPEG